MKKILMKHSNKAYLPQIEATIEYFSGRDVPFQLIGCTEPDLQEPEADIIWTFPGVEIRRPIGLPVIHEYASLSTGRLPLIKNRLKKVLNVKPELRIFLNHSVQKAYGFNDQIPSIRRDMGVHQSFFNQQLTKKSYDVVYCGSITRSRGIHKVLNHFKSIQKDCSLLLIGGVEDDLYQAFKDADNITFTGKLPYSDVPGTAAQAVHGLNYIPSRYPFHLQTSTKLLEYIALDLHIITTKYPWADEFRERYNLPFTYISEDLDDLVIRQSTELPVYDHIMKQQLSWNSVIEQSGLEKALYQLVLRNASND